LLAGNAVPDYLFGSLLLLLFAGWHWHWLPSHGLKSPGAAEWGTLARLGDLVLHLILPVLTLALGPLVLVLRFVRDATARAAAQPFAQQWHALGLPPALVRKRLRRHALVPLATLAGGLLPMLVGGSVVVEQLFSLDGIGQLAFGAVRDLDHAMVMLLTVVGAIATLLALFVSDVLHRWIDPRVRFVA
jgi:peptide/nickel transport system permease protein